MTPQARAAALAELALAGGLGAEGGQTVLRGVKADEFVHDGMVRRALLAG
ncbi:hypothetical protein [Deinococcus sp.]